MCFIFNIQKTKKHMKLSDIEIGGRAVIVKVAGHGGFRRRIVEMGFIKGKVVEVLNRAPLGDPIEYAVMGYNVSLRLSEAIMGARNIHCDLCFLCQILRATMIDRQGEHYQ